MEIAPDIHSIPSRLDSLLEHFAPRVYFVAGQKHGALINSGYALDEIIDTYIEYVRNKAKGKIDYIIITHAHRDHISAVPLIRGKTGARFILHSAEVTDVPVDRRVDDGDVISLGGVDLEVVHTPGHSPGHICLYIRDRKIMFTGDHVMARSTTSVRPPWGDMDAYIDSLKKLQKFDIDLMLPAHGPPIKEPQKRLEERIQLRMKREDQILKLLQSGVSSVEEITAKLYPRRSGSLYDISREQVYAHLLKLEKDGTVLSSGEGRDADFKIS